MSLLAQVSVACGGDLDRLVRVVKLTGFVASAPGFADQPKVVNGASDFMVDVLGEAGRHARSAVGVAALPLGVAVEGDGGEGAGAVVTGGHGASIACAGVLSGRQLRHRLGRDRRPAPATPAGEPAGGTASGRLVGGVDRGAVG
jgi:hypothetical protein